MPESTPTRSPAEENEEYASHGPVLTSEEARQGVTSGRIRLILMVSLALTVVAFVVVFAVSA